MFTKRDDKTLRGMPRELGQRIREGLDSIVQQP
jgi:hypothetical protein